MLSQVARALLVCSLVASTLLVRAAAGQDVPPSQGRAVIGREAAEIGEDAAPSDGGPAPSDPVPAASDDVSAPRSAQADIGRITITATRMDQAVPDPAASVTVLDEHEVAASPAFTLDDLLRVVPGFSLFRRTSSLVAHPTAQGVSLRGIGPTGASRALVLVDGVPLNDPFGGWVYWGMVPLESIRNIEVLRGAGSSVWGNYAMSGVINVATRAPDRDEVRFTMEGGERHTASLQGYASRRVSPGMGVAMDGRLFSTGGYPVVRADQRGPIDEAADSEDGTSSLRVDLAIGPHTTARLQARGFHEERNNGTPLTRNETSAGFFRAGFDSRLPGLGRMQTDVFATTQTFESTFSSQSPDRSFETPALDQFDVPSTSVGAASIWSGRPLDGHVAALGIDASWIEGKTQELFRFLDGAFTRRRDAGAQQSFAGLFVEDLWSVTDRLDISASARLDYWTVYDGFRREHDLATGGQTVDRELASRDELVISPRLGLAYAIADAVSMRAAVYRGFRAPTLNELVRPFRVRNDITEANDALDSEKVLGAESGIDVEAGRVQAQATFFWNQVEDPIFNVTVGEGPGDVPPCGFVPEGGVCRQRRNLGRTSIFGIESDVRVELGGGFEVAAAYLWSDGEIVSAAAAPALIGNRIPQVPEHQASLGVFFDRIDIVQAGLQLRYVGEQFEDDANERELGDYLVFDASVSREIMRGWHVFVKAENLFEREYETGQTADGLVSIGAPRIVRAGLRYAWD
ncbi:MAG TPA: TonB-dependent receptor [Candidatus Binatia bacterium]|nr:TonB-dependent receptor [Candidatus Binatia bacterium]